VSVYCATCHAIVRNESPERCLGCGASLTAADAIIAADDLATHNRSRSQRWSLIGFVTGGAVLGALPLYLWSYPGALQLAALVYGAIAGVVIHRFIASRTLTTLIYAVPLGLMSGFNPFTWLFYICFGMALAIGRDAAADL